MNKYQEALDYFTIGRTFTEEEAEYMYEMRYRLAELVDKETPMKPLSKGWVGGIMIFKCRNCNDRQNCIYNAPKRCGNCGKVIDWGKDDNS